MGNPNIYSMALQWKPPFGNFIFKSVGFWFHSREVFLHKLACAHTYSYTQVLPPPTHAEEPSASDCENFLWQEKEDEEEREERRKKKGRRKGNFRRVKKSPSSRNSTLAGFRGRSHQRLRLSVFLWVLWLWSASLSCLVCLFFYFPLSHISKICIH